MAILVVISCSQSPFGNTGGGAVVVTTPGATPVPGANATIATNTSLSVQVQTSYDLADATKTTQGECDIPAGAAVGTSTPCKITIPEGQLFYSKLYINTTVARGACEIFFFAPYYYKASAAALPVAPATGGFIPEWNDGSAIDCSLPDNKISADCFNGPATVLIPTFPKFDHLYLLPDANGIVQPQSYTIPSANSSKRRSNRWTANSLSAANRFNSGNPNFSGDGYVAGTMQDYVITCSDRWLQPIYQIVLTIDDENITPGQSNDPNNGNINARANWNSIFDPL